ncbi:hypothetical protein HYO62_03310 [Aerococcaceae bacterium DSM 111022]|nr:hypothetical protein [Aerococcaceae bacterium DSM 111022]
MSKEIIEQVKDAEIKMGQLSQTMKKEKQGLQDKMTQEKEAFKAHLDQQLQAHKTALTEQYEEKLQTEKNQSASLAKDYQNSISEGYSKEKNQLVLKGIEEVMNAYGYRNHEATDDTL